MSHKFMARESFPTIPSHIELVHCFPTLWDSSADLAVPPPSYLCSNFRVSKIPWFVEYRIVSLKALKRFCDVDSCVIAQVVSVAVGSHLSSCSRGHRRTT